MKADFLVDGWLVQPSLGRISKDGRIMLLRAKVMDLLVFLATQPGKVISKDELLDGVWGTDAISESALTVTIAELRQAFGDDVDRPHLIETISKRGYRLIAEVRPETDSAAPPAPIPLRASRRWWLVASAALIVAAAAWLAPGMMRTEEISHFRTRVVTTLDGVEHDPALSPDGSQIAFVWNAALYVQTINGGEPRLVVDEVESAAWSPDGQSIATLRVTEGNQYDLLVLPALGGSERRVGRFFAGYWRSVSWSPDGRSLAIVHNAPGEPSGVFAVSVRTGEARPLSEPLSGATATNDKMPAFSNDGLNVAFIRNFGSTFEIIRVPAAGGPETAIGSFSGAPLDLDWTADDRELIVSIRTGDSLSTLWRVSLSGGSPVQLQGGENAARFAIKNGRLAYAQLSSDNELWFMSSATGSGAAPSRPLLQRGRNDMLPRFSPDGRRVAFVSGRSSTAQIWVCDSNGSACRQLTHDGHTDWPAWSPDSLAIAYNVSGNDIYVVDAKGGPSRRLTDHPAFDIGPGWSRDGRFVYFNSLRTGEWRMWRAPVEGGASTDAGFGAGSTLHESSDGWFYFWRPRESAIRRVRADGRDAQIVARDVPANSGWTLWRDSVLLVRKGDVLYRVDDAGKLHEFRRLWHSGQTEELRAGCQDFDVAPNGDVVFCVGRTHGDIVLIENFK